MPSKKIPASYLRDPLHFLSLGFGSGLAPFAPGTFGTVAAIPVYWLLSPLPLVWYLLVIVLAFMVGIYLCDYTSRALGVHDHSGIVWDEIVGYLITMIAMPSNFWWVITGFVLFRFFDIVKPWPVSWADKSLSGGMGIMVDDVLAGFYGLACIQLSNFLISD